MINNSLHLLLSDVNLDYNRSNHLKQIRIGSNKTQEMKGNGLLTEERLKAIKVIYLIKSNKKIAIEVESVSLKIRHKSKDTELGKFLLHFDSKLVAKKIGDFDVTKRYTREYIVSNLQHDKKIPTALKG